MKSIFKILSVIFISSIAFPIISHAEGDPAKGEKQFKRKCRVCHNAAQGEKAKVGPNLFGIHGNAAGQFDGYKYSKGLIEANLTWDDATLDAYLEKPKNVVKKGKMIFAGFKKKKDRDDVIAYLKTLK